jgi:hypothetical protein
MVLRIRQNPETPPSQFERTALRITGTSFYCWSRGWQSQPFIISSARTNPRRPCLD